MFTVPPTLQSFGEVVAQKFQRPESRALPTFGSAEAGNATPKAAFRSLELAVPTHGSQSLFSKADALRSLHKESLGVRCARGHRNSDYACFRGPPLTRTAAR